MPIHIETVYTKETLGRLARFSVTKNKTLWILYIIAELAAMILSFSCVMTAETPEEFFLSVVLIAPGLSLAFPFIIMLKLLMTRDRNKLVDGSLNIYDIYDDRVVLTSNLSNATGQSVYSFQSFNKIYETKYAFYLSLSKYQALIIDKSAMTEEGIVRFRDIIGRNVLKGKYKLKLKSSILPLIISAVVIISFLAFNTVYGFMYFTNNVSDEYKVKTFVIPSTEFCISVPSSWTELDLNDAASFQMGNPRKEQYMIIISEPVADFGYDFELEDYADALGEYMSGNIDSAMKSQAAETVIGTNIKAIQFEIEGSIQGIDAKYLVTCAQIGDSYYQFTAWSLQSEYENVVPVFNDILGSIGENI